MEEGKSRAWHEVILTFDILIGACILGGAIIFATVWKEGRLSSNEMQSLERSARKQFLEQVLSGLQGSPTIQGKKRQVQSVTISDLRFSTSQDRMLVEFSVSANPSANVADSVILANDGFGRFAGDWATDDKTIHILVK